MLIINGFSRISTLAENERIAQALRNVGISYSQDDLEELEGNYEVIRQGLDKALATLNLAEVEPDFIYG